MWTWRFQLKKQRKIPHLQVQLIQISVPKTHQLAESCLYWGTSASKLLNSLFRHSPNQVKALLGKSTTADTFFLSVPFFSLICLPSSIILLLIMSAFTRCPSVCVLNDCEGSRAVQVLFSGLVCLPKPGLPAESKVGGFIWQDEATQGQIFNMEANDDTKKGE